MAARTPVTVITGPLGSGKTTLLRLMLDVAQRKLAIIMNEFGELAIDSKIIEGKNIRMAELAGGCVCCSLVGEFEAAINELIDAVAPEQIVVEATGLAEPEALAYDIQENLPRVRLDGVVSVMDADGLLRFPSLGHTTRMQIEAADLLLLNKTDLAPAEALARFETQLREINPAAPIVRTQRCAVDLDLLFGIARTRDTPAERHIHQPEFESFSVTSSARFDREAFGRFAETLAPAVYRAKGFVQFADESCLFNFVNGRWDLEPFASDATELVFIGRQLDRDAICSGLAGGELPPLPYEFIEGLTVADIAFRARGADLESVFIAAGEATLSAMIDNLDAIEPREQRAFQLENDALDLLLFNFLNEIIYHKDCAQLLLRVDQVAITQTDGNHRLTAQAHGERLDPERHHQRVDVKAVTLHHFKLEQTADGWEAQVVLDI